MPATKKCSEAERLAHRLGGPNPKHQDRIPPFAYVGAALFVAGLYALMFVGALAGF